MGIVVTKCIEDGQSFTNFIVIHPAEQCSKWRITASGCKQQRAEISRCSVQPKLAITTRRRRRGRSTEVSRQCSSLTKR
jgi:hypothetical protein